MLKKQIVRFLIVGILNTVVYYILYSLFLYFKFDYRMAVAFATIIGVLFNFKSFGKYVFDNNDNSIIYKFIGVYIILFLTNILLINVFYILINNYYIAGFFAIFPYAIVSYYLNKEFVFKKKESINS